MIFTATDAILLFAVLVALLALGAVISVGNERVRRATLSVRDVAREWGLADMALKREQLRRDIHFDSSEAGRVLAQIALDVTGERLDFAEVRQAVGDVPALLARAVNGMEVVFTPSGLAFLRVNPGYRRRAERTYAVSGLEAGPFVAEELAALARACGLTALPRTEQWDMLVLKPEDFSIAGKSARLRFTLTH